MKPSEAVRDIAYEITCPICEAKPAEPCVNVFTGVAQTWPHETRQWIARDQGLSHDAS